MPASRKSVELSLKRQVIDWIATEGGGVPSRAEAHFCQRGWRVKAASRRKSQTTFNRNGGVVGNDSAAPGSRQCGEEEHRLVRRGLRHLWTIKLLIAAAPTRTRSTSFWTL
ncbi:hypothetical protein PC128_g12837 [Phytophthora cactorum]|nr:hypothetical protein PC128_g12837 [Phytophthora cactorum]